jgi:hypothetical protein
MNRVVICCVELSETVIARSVSDEAIQIVARLDCRVALCAPRNDESVL